MEGNQIKFAEGEMDECTWLQISKIKDSVLIPENEQKEVLKDFKNQKYHSRLLKLSKANLIFFYIGNKLFFLDKSNLSSLFKKDIKSTYDNFLYWEFSSEIKYIRIIDLKYPMPRDDISFEDLDKTYCERFIVIFLANECILIESDKFVSLVDNLNKNNFNAKDYFLNNSLIIETNNNLNTDNFIILDDNQSENLNDSYHFFFINYPANMNKDLMYLSEINSKNYISNLKYFKIKKNAIYKNNSAPNPYKMSSDTLNIIDFGINAILVEHVESDLLCLNLNESLHFFKIQFSDGQTPKLLPATVQNQNVSSINLKKIAFEDKDPNESILDISLIKKIRPNCLFVSGFEYPKSSKSPNKDSMNTNFFIQYTYDNINGILNDINVSFFLDTYYPDDVYNFESKPVMEVIHLNYQVELLLLANSQDKQLESFSFSDEIESLDIKFAALEDEYKFCLPVFDQENDEYSKNAVPIGLTYIDFSFNGYDKEKYIINADEVYAPYLILILDNYGRLFFGYVVNKLLTENPLKKDERDVLLKGSFKIPLISEAVSATQNKSEMNPLSMNIKPEQKQASTLFGNLSGAGLNAPKNIEEQLNFSFGNQSNFGNNQPSLQNNLNAIFVKNVTEEDKKEKENKFKDLFLKDNKPSEVQEQQQNSLFGIKPNEPKTSEKKMEINFDQSKNNLITLDSKENKKQEEEEYENIINLDVQEKINKEKKQDTIKIDKLSKENIPSISQKIVVPSQAEEENSSSSDSENVSTSTSKLVNKPCERIVSKEAANEGQRILTNPKNVGVETQWYSEKIEEYKKQKEKLLQLREKEKKELLEKFEKDSIEIKSETERIIKQKEDEYQKRLAELQKEKQKITEIQEAKEKKRIEDIEKNKEEAKKIANELKEKIFNESKKNIACNLEVYLEIIKYKVDGFIQETQKLKRIEEEMKENNKIYTDIEKEIENFNLKKADVENKIYDFYETDYNSDIEYLNERLSNLVEIVFRDNKKLSSKEIEEFIYNNQLNLSADNKKKVLAIKQNFEKMILRFNEKLAKFKKQAEESEKLVDKFSNNQKINDILELNDKYEGSLNKFVQSYPQENNINNFVFNTETSIKYDNNQINNNFENKGVKNFNFNRGKFNLKNIESKPNNPKPHNKLNNYTESAHTKIFQDIMTEYEREFESLKNQFETIKKEIADLHTISIQSSNNPIAEMPLNADFNFNKRVFSESAIKNFYKNYKQKSDMNSQDGFSNINLHNEFKNNRGKALQNHIPSVEYIDDKGDDLDEVFNKGKKPGKAEKPTYGFNANAAEFREMKKCEFANIFGTKQLNDVYQKYKDQCNLAKIIENAQSKANREFEGKNKNLSAFAQELKKEKKDNSIPKNKPAQNLNDSKTSSSKNLDSSFNSSKNAQGDSNTSMLSSKLNDSAMLNNNQKQLIPGEKRKDEKLFGNNLIPEQPKAEKPKQMEPRVESSQEKKLLQPKEPPFGLKKDNEPKEEKPNKSLFPAASELSRSPLTNVLNKNQPAEAPKEKEEEKPKQIPPTNLFANTNTNSASLFQNKGVTNPFQSAVNNPLIPKPKETENKAEAKVPVPASTGLFSGTGINSGQSLFSGAAPQQKQEEKKEASKDKEPKAAEAPVANKNDAFSSLIQNANIQKPSAEQSEKKSEAIKDKKEIQPEAPKSGGLFGSVSGNQVAGATGFNPFNTAAQAAKPKEEEKKKEALPQEDKTAPPIDSTNVVFNLFNQNLSFSKQTENAENKVNKDTNANAPAANISSNNIVQSNSNALFPNLQPKADANLAANKIAVSNAANSLNQDNAKKEENKNSLFPSQANTSSSANPPGMNFANLFKPSIGPPGAANQVPAFPGFGKPQQGAPDANKPTGSIFPNLSNQANNAAPQNTGFAGFGQSSSLNANQNQQQFNPLGGNAVPSADSNAIPKFGFGQSSSLGAPVAVKPPTTTMNIGFGKNLGNAGGFGNQGGFAGVAANNPGGFFGQNQAGFGANAGGNMPFVQNPINNNLNAGFAGLNNNQVNAGFGGFGGGFNMNANPNNAFGGGFNNANNANNANNNMFFNQQPQQQQNNINRPGAGPMKNDYDF